jgi:hypothetical protein
MPRIFDIAVSHLKDINLIGLYMTENLSDEAVPEKEEMINRVIEAPLMDFKRNPQNISANEHARAVMFLAAVHHMIDLAHGRVSGFDVACEIVESNADVLKTKFEKFGRTDYPKIMVDKWLLYCNGIKNDKPYYLSHKSDIQLEIMFSAYHYIIDKV